MKIISKMLLIVLLLLGLSLPLAYRAYAMAQISLQNNSSFWLNLYIDKNFGCGPVIPNGFCTSSVTEVSHSLDARKGGDSSTILMSQLDVNIGNGTSPTETVNYKEPATVEGEWEIISENLADYQQYIGRRLIISHKGDGYEVKSLFDGNSATFSGNERRITRTSLEDLHDAIPEGEGPHFVLNPPAPVNVSFTLSGDGRFLQREGDSVMIYYKKDTGRFDHYEIEQGYIKTTYKRISGPVSKPMQ